MTSITIKKASTEDLKTVQNVAIETFYETFAPHNSEEAMRKYLDESFASEKLIRELKNPDSQFFIASEGEIAIGYLKVNSGKEQTELQDETSLEIERIYVKSAYHGKKVGQILYNKALEIALQEKKKYLWLGVWEENVRAVNFHKKNGFVEFATHVFKLGNEEQTDLIMKKVLE